MYKAAWYKFVYNQYNRTTNTYKTQLHTYLEEY